MLHQDLALADGCIDGGIDQAEEQVPEEVVVVERSGRLVVEDGKVCGAAGGNLAEAKPELPLGDLRIVVQQKLRRLHKCHARIVIGEPVEQVGAAHLRKHVG